MGPAVRLRSTSSMVNRGDRVRNVGIALIVGTFRSPHHGGVELGLSIWTSRSKATIGVCVRVRVCVYMHARVRFLVFIVGVMQESQLLTGLIETLSSIKLDRETTRLKLLLPSNSVGTCMSGRCDEGANQRKI